MPACWRSARYHAVARRGASQHLPDPASRARHQSGQCRDGRHKVVVVGCDRDGNVDLADLRAKAEQQRPAGRADGDLPRTHGVFEAGSARFATSCMRGGQVYMDGANMNAQVGLTSPAAIGADVCHLNLHKTFCIPHGGGGPGVGPIGVAAHLAPFCRITVARRCGAGERHRPGEAAPFGSA